jgi:hypothetical protein
MKKGDIIIWQVDHVSYTAKPGAKAIVQKDLLPTDEWVSVKWVGYLSNGQLDGGYSPSMFKKEENESN